MVFVQGRMDLSLDETVTEKTQASFGMGFWSPQVLMAIPLLIANYHLYKFMLTICQDTPRAYRNIELIETVSFPGFQIGLKINNLAYPVIGYPHGYLVESLAYGFGALLQTALQMLVLSAVYAGALRAKPER